MFILMLFYFFLGTLIDDFPTKTSMFFGDFPLPCLITGGLRRGQSSELPRQSMIIVLRWFLLFGLEDMNPAGHEVS